MELSKTFWWWLNGSSGSVPPSDDWILTKLSVKYTDIDHAYITSKSGFQLGATFNAGTNVIGICTIVPDDSANSSLCYDQETDRLIVLHLDGSGHIGYKFFNKDTVHTAMAAAIGTIPATDYSFVGHIGSLHGMTVDPVNQILYAWTGVTIREYDIATGTLLANRSHDSGYATPGTISYNYETGDMWISIGTETVQAGKRMRLVSGNWVTQESTWFVFTQEMTVDPFVQGGLITKKNSSDGTQHFITQKFTGFKPEYHRNLLDNIQFYSNTQQCVRDARNGTFWMNVDINYHEADYGADLPNENVLIHMDPYGLYKKYLRFPDMHRFDLFKRSSSLSGRYNAQELIGSAWNIAPVVDYASYTGQQDINNWEIGEEDAAELEFRGSDTAPTTTIIDDYDNSSIKLYDANGSNEGWGSTTPGSWQSTPTAHRYMQVRIKPIEYTPTWTPADLGSDLLLWSEQNSLDGLVYEKVDSDRCPIAINYANPYANFSNGSATQKPTWNAGGEYVDMIANSRHYQLDSAAINALKTEDNLEVHVVARKNAASSRVYFLGVSQLGSANNQIAMMHSGSGATPPNFLSFECVNGAGTLSRYGITDTSVTAWRMVTFKMGGSTNKIYVNNVEQSLTLNTGSNVGQCFDDLGSGTDQMCLGRLRGSTSLAGVQHQRLIIITRPLSDANRALLLDYCQRIGAVD